MNLSRSISSIGIFLFGLVIGMLTVGIASSQPSRCNTGSIRGFAVVRGDPRLGGIGALPNSYTNERKWFEIRYNCTGKGVQAKRVDEGVYNIAFPDNPSKVAIVSANTDQAVSASVDRIDNGVFQITLRGPLVENNLLVRREVSFYIVIA